MPGVVSTQRLALSLPKGRGERRGRRRIGEQRTWDPSAPESTQFRILSPELEGNSLNAMSPGGVRVFETTVTLSPTVVTPSGSGATGSWTNGGSLPARVPVPFGPLLGRA